ncbi:MAG: hypothetical protein U1E61_15720 [Bradyrhizobium sp.]
MPLADPHRGAAVAELELLALWICLRVCPGQGRLICTGLICNEPNSVHGPPSTSARAILGQGNVDEQAASIREETAGKKMARSTFKLVLFRLNRLRAEVARRARRRICWSGYGLDIPAAGAGDAPACKVHRQQHAAAECTRTHN